LESRVHVPKKALAAEAVVAEASPFRPARIVPLERRRHRDTSRDVVLVVVVVLVVIVILVLITIVLVTIVLVRLADLCRRRWIGSIEHPRAFAFAFAISMHRARGKKTHAFHSMRRHIEGVFDEGGVDDESDERDE
jgi:hypothetical protein